MAGLGLVIASAAPAYALVPSVGDQSVNGLNRTTTTGNPAVPSGGTGGTNYCSNVITPFGNLANNANPTGFSGGGVTWTITKNDGVAETGGQSDFQYNKNGTTPSGVQGNVTNYYQLGMDVSGTSTAQGYVPSDVTNPSATAGQYEDVILTADQPVTSLSFTVLDVDTRPPDGNYRDVVGVVGSTTAGGTYDVTPTVTAVGSQVSSTLRGAEAVISGQSNVAATSRDSNATMTFATPITQVRIRYSSGALPASGNQGESNNVGGGATRQLIGISPFQYCGASVGTAKTVSAPVRNGSTYTVEYTFTLENTGGVRIYRPQLFDVAPVLNPTSPNGDGLTAAFGAVRSGAPTGPGTFSVGTPTIVTNTADPVAVNPAFLGYGSVTTGSMLRNDTGSIGPNERVQVRLPVTFWPRASDQTAINNGSATFSDKALGGGNLTGNTSGTMDVIDASASGTNVDPTGNGRADDDNSPTQFSIARDPGVSLTKAYAGTYTDADSNGQVSVGDTLNYQFVVTNTGNVPLATVTINDAKIPAANITCPAGAIDVAASKTCTGSYVVTAADAAATQTVNNATVTATPSGTGATPITSARTPDVVVPVPEQASIDLQKSFASGAGPFTVGQVVNYTFTLTNTGRVPLTAVSITDAKLGLTDDVCGAATLAPQATSTCSRPYTITQADVNAGQLVNSATTTGTSPSGRTVNDTADARVVVQQNPAITLTKAQTGNNDADGSGAVSAGDQLTYTFTTRNTGNVTLNPVTVADPKLGVTNLACGGPLDPGATGTCTATYTVTQADENAGTIVNTATVTGRSPIGVDVTATSRATTPVVPATPAISLVKSVSGTLTTGSTLSYQFLVTNTGPVRLTSVGVTDPVVGTVTCPDTSLAAGASTTCTGSYTVTQADVDAGSRSNTATARGTGPGGTTVTDTSTAVLRGTPTAAIEITKTHRAGTFAAGDEVTYEFAITNKGNVTLNPVSFSDPKLGITGATCGQASLAPGDSTTCTRTYTITQTDADAGTVDNTATTTGVPPAATGLPNATDTDDDTVPVEQAPQLSFDKSYTSNADGDGNGRVSAGDVLTYTLVATNTGNVTLTDTQIGDNKITSLTCTPTQPRALAPNAALTCTGTYTATAADVNAGRIDNTAAASARPPTGPRLTSTDSATVILPQSPGISLTKSFARKLDRDNSGGDSAGDGIVYSFTILNTGNVTLNPVTLSDPTLGLSGVTCGATSLAANATATCEQTYTVTQADINAGTKANTATVTGQPPAGISPVTDTSNETVPLVRISTITLDKATTSTTAEAGDVIPYTFLVTNTGNVPLNPVVVTDNKVGTVTCTGGALAPGAPRTCTASYTVTTADVDAGSVVNTATATGTPPTGVTPPTATDTVRTPVTGNPEITLTKTNNAPANATVGTTYTYTLVARNSGDTTLNNVTISDPLVPTLTCTPAQPATRAPGASLTCTGPYTVTQADADRGSAPNTATVVGTPANGAAQVRDTDTNTVPITRTANFTLDKAANVARASVGDVVTYTFTLVNTGNVTLTGVTVTDPLPGLSALTCSGTSFAANGRITCTATRMVTQADADAGTINNTATARVTPPNGVTNPGPKTDTATVLVTPPAPTANPDVSSGPQAQRQTVNPLANDTAGSASSPLAPATLTYLTPAGDPVATITVPNQGTYTIDRTNPAVPLFAFQPLPTFTGTATPVNYRISDSTGQPAFSTYTPTVVGISPLARPDATSGPQGIVQRTTPLGNDAPGASSAPLVPSTLTYLNGSGAPVATITVPNQGVYSIDRSNPAAPQFVFTPEPDFVGTATPAPYRISDSNGTSATSTYTPTLVGVTPIARPDVSSGPQNTPQSVLPLGNDAPGNASVPLVPSTLTYLTAGGTPVATIVVPNQGTYSIDRSTPASPRFVFTPEPQFTGTATPAPYGISDANGTRATSTYTPTIDPITPAAQPDTSSGRQGQVQRVYPLTNDSPGDASVPLVPSTLTYLNDAGTPVDTITVPNQGTYTIDRSSATTPQFVFTPLPNFIGTATPAPYRISDRNGTPATSTYTPTVVGVTPIAQPDFTAGTQGQVQRVYPLDNDAPGLEDVPLVPSTLTYFNGAGDPVDTITVPNEGTYTISRTNPARPQFVFTPLPNFFGEATPAPYRIADRNGTTAQTTYTPTVTRVVPEAEPDTTIGPQGVAQSIDPLTNDAPGDPGVPLVPSTVTYLDGTTPVETITIPGEGVYTIDRSTPTAPKFVFTPEPQFVGTATPAPYGISDSNGTQATSTYTPTLQGVDPVARPDVSSGPQNTPQSAPALANDSAGSSAVPLVPSTLTYLDGSGNPVATITVPGQGVYSIDRTTPAAPRFVFTPEPQFTGQATTVPYRISDRNGSTADSTYTPTVTPIVPTARPDSSTGPRNRPQSVNPLANDAPGAPTIPLDPTSLTLLDGAGLPVPTVTVAGQGVYSVDRTNPNVPRLVFTPEPDFVGVATPAPYAISDSNGTPARSTYTPTVLDTAPIARPDTSSGPQNTPQSVAPLGNDSPGDPAVPLVPSTLTLLDGNGDPTTSVTVPNQGTYTVDRSNPAVPRIVFTPEPDFTGRATPVPYRVDDQNGTPAITTYTPTVTPGTAAIVTAKRVSDGPTVSDGVLTAEYTVEVGNAGRTALTRVQVTDDLTVTFADADGFEVTAISSPTLTVNPDFDGDADVNLLAGTDTLAPGTGGAIVFTVRVDLSTTSGTFENQAVGRGIGPRGPVEDPSDSGTLGCNPTCTDLDPNDDHPGEPGNEGTPDDPTPLNYDVSPGGGSDNPPLASTGADAGLGAAGLVGLLLVGVGAAVLRRRRG